MLKYIDRIANSESFLIIQLTFALFLVGGSMIEAAIHHQVWGVILNGVILVICGINRRCSAQ
jgi:hypothetical protein